MSEETIVIARSEDEARRLLGVPEDAKVRIIPAEAIRYEIALAPNQHFYAVTVSTK